MATSKKTAGSITPAGKLKNIENIMYTVGVTYAAAWDTKRDNPTVRMAIAAFRTSMQAMRDASRYKGAAAPKKKRIVKSKT